MSHLPVLLNEVLEVFAESDLNIFIDGTLGAGGHSKAILEAHPEIQLLIGCDQDPAALKIAQHNLKSWNHKIHYSHLNFSQIDTLLSSLGIEKVSGILLDIGVSSMQFDQPEKGFSFMREGPLDMRMNPDNEISAFEIINHWSEADLARIFRDYGEEKRWRAAARAIVQARSHKPIVTTLDLGEVLKPVLFKNKKGINPLTLIFQALRIAVNNELEHLEIALPKAIEKLVKRGKLAVISFHSLEDRIVKNVFREASSDKVNTSGLGEGLFLDKTPEVKLITRKPICPTEQEVMNNNRARSAKMRVVEKL